MNLVEMAGKFKKTVGERFSGLGRIDTEKIAVDLEKFASYDAGRMSMGPLSPFHMEMVTRARIDALRRRSLENEGEQKI